MGILRFSAISAQFLAALNKKEMRLSSRELLLGSIAPSLEATTITASPFLLPLPTASLPKLLIALISSLAVMKPATSAIFIHGTIPRLLRGLSFLLLLLQFLCRLLHKHLRLLQVGWEPCVHTLPTLPPIRAEPRHIEATDGFPLDMSVFANRPQGTKTPLVMRTCGPLPLRRNVLVHAIIPVGAEAVPTEVVALGHLSEVVLVQELAGLALFAQAAHPMLAH